MTYSRTWLLLPLVHSLVSGVGGVDSPVGALARVILGPRHLLETLVER